MRLNHVTLIISDLDASLRFYEKLGLRPIVLAEPRYARLVFPDGDETLSLEVTGEAAQPSRVQLYFECLDLDAVWARLERDLAGLDHDAVSERGHRPVAPVQSWLLRARKPDFRRHRGERA